MGNISNSGEIRTVFLQITDLFDGRAETIEKALLQFCETAAELTLEK